MNESMEALIAYGYGIIRNEPQPSLPLEALIAGLKQHTEYMTGWATGKSTLYGEWLDAGPTQDCEDVVMKWLNVANDCFAVHLAWNDLYKHFDEASKRLLDPIIVSQMVPSDIFRQTLRQQTDVIATIVDTPYWHNNRAMFGDNQPWWFGQEVIDEAGKLQHQK